jgi:hypothetical protein
MKKSRLLGAICACITLYSTNAFTADKDWICGDGSWDDGSCWNPAGQPTGGDSAFLTQSDSTDRTVTYANPLYPSGQVGRVTIDSTGTGTMTLLFSQGTVDEYDDFSYLIIGDQGTGIFTQTGGSILDQDGIRVTDLGNMANAGSQGTYNLIGGVFETDWLNISEQSTFNQSGGSAYARLWANFGGVYNISGGELSAQEFGLVFDGVFNQTGGDVVIIDRETSSIRGTYPTT